MTTYEDDFVEETPEERRQRVNSLRVGQSSSSFAEKNNVDFNNTPDAPKKKGFSKGGMFGAGMTAIGELGQAASKDSTPDSYMEQERKGKGGMEIGTKLAGGAMTGMMAGGPVGAAAGVAIAGATMLIESGKDRKFNKRLQVKKDDKKLETGQDNKITFEKLQDADKKKSVKYLSEINNARGSYGYSRFKRYTT